MTDKDSCTGSFSQRFMHRFVVNEHLDVAWDTQDVRVRVLVDGKPISQCVFIVANVSPTNQEIKSIDDLARLPGAHQMAGRATRMLLSIEEEVAAHASNIQAWAEHDYDTRLLHSNIAFPVLKALAWAGDPKAMRVLFPEIVGRIRDGTNATRQALMDTCRELLYADLIAPHLGGVPDDERIILWNTIGTMFKKSGDLRGAAAAYRKAIAIDPAPGHVPFPLLETLAKVGDERDDAVLYPALARGIMKGAHDAWALMEACRDRFDADRFNHLLEGLSAGEKFTIWHALGTFFFQSEDLNRAMGAYRRAIAIDPARSYTSLTLLVTLAREGDEVEKQALDQEIVRRIRDATRCEGALLEAIREMLATSFFDRGKSKIATLRRFYMKNWTCPNLM
jgi:tetratricopeptide (TPR) repeat protein